MILRAPRKAAAYFKAKDPDSAITECFIRREIREGNVPTIQNGVKVLIDVEAYERDLSSRLRG